MANRWICLLALAAWPALTGRAPRTRAADPPPNFVVILCDDLGYGDIGPFGAEAIATPNLDRMAAEGVKLTSFYASANVCTPSRAGLLTGRLAIRMGLAVGVLFPSSENGLPPEERTLAEILQSAGYRTAAVGKWHLGSRPEFWPTRHGFDFYYGLPYSNDMKPLALYRMEEKIEEPVDQSTLTRRYAEESERFIEENRDRPFFLYLAHTFPHVPLHVSKEFQGRSRASLYGDVVEEIDWSVGRILETLARLGLDDRTLVIFTSDNGPWWEGDAAGLRDRKGSSWEGGMRVPFLARWPGRIPAGAESAAIAMNTDLLPTLAALAGAQPPEDRPLDGKDIRGLLQGGGESPHEYLLLFNEDQIAAVRTPRWKLVVRTYYKKNEAVFGREGSYYHPGLLFDMERAGETYSVAREHPDVQARLREILDRATRELKGERETP